jgi:hypothetical protein
VLEVLLANYPAVAVRRAEVVTLLELLDSNDTLPVPREMIKRGTSHCTEPDNDHVVLCHVNES